MTVELGLRKALIRHYRCRSGGQEAETEINSATVDKRVAHAHNNSVAIILESGVIFHSVFIGIGLGISQEAAVIRPLMIALMFHQAFEGLALGTVFVKAGFSTVKYGLAAAAFALITPVGVAIGMVSKYNEAGSTELGVEGAFNAISSGILIYNGLVDLVLPSFSDEQLPERPIMQVLGLGFMFAGFALMALLAKWA
ncbi:hypothetical protein WJX72_001258 [[Myrmecia] bisecta]|uniref:Uncharacterized protein n=1 Tax=[Myrmecia] bisecta TaxID=41462 RepID=A0AAW1Q607_9CHLO